MKTDFSKVLFTNGTHATLGRTDGWSKSRDGKQVCEFKPFKAPKGGGGIMIWDLIIYGLIVGPWRVIDWPSRPDNDNGKTIS